MERVGQRCVPRETTCPCGRSRGAALLREVASCSSACRTSLTELAGLRGSVHLGGRRGVGLRRRSYREVRRASANLPSAHSPGSVSSGTESLPRRTVRERLVGPRGDLLGRHGEWRSGEGGIAARPRRDMEWFRRASTQAGVQGEPSPRVRRGRRAPIGTTARPGHGERGTVWSSGCST